jgi:competence ComEA-like helix-hairpin-helix protein
MVDNKLAVFSRYERNGIIFLVILILFSILFKNYIVHLLVKEKQLSVNDKQKIALLQQQINEAKNSYITYNNSSYKETSYKRINPENYTNSISYQKKKDYYDFTIEVNSATQQDFEKLYGIGKVYAERIITFRDKLGGFYSINQLKDVFGIEDSTFQKFKKNLTIKPVKPKKININTATYDELITNPYFFSTVAKQIVGYRNKIKQYSSIEDVKNLYFVKDHPEHYDKMLPYIAIN